MKLPTPLDSYVHAITHLGRSAPIRVLVHPMREWVTCLSITIFAALVLIAFSGFDFYIQYNSVDTPVIVDSSVSKYREGDAESIIKYYEGKASLFTNLRSNRVVSVESAVSENFASSTLPALPVAVDGGGE